ncbi:FAD-dependent monooxygenase [Cryptosporangium phraense]|uniref:Oxidoreductase n=1 Tax=Cryptosporangium phraense TaxID=2593070 RepID=A0A545AV56_9ACTN|nr:FAD-dependent monooxygenase [Cryptosporangium phraense]TQS45217.1 oxidoreductase [Cryptosporangium phraense]
MKLRSVAVLGGGPGGLYVARLLKLSRPECQVDVYEQSPPEQTFGFGVGLASRTQRNLAAADPASLADIVGASYRHGMAMTVGDTTVRLPAGDLIAIGRSTLLEILRRHAEAAGVRVHYGSRIPTPRGTDLVVAADGVSSATREAGDFGARITTHRGLYLWCGTDFALPSAVFRPATTEFGTFVAHAYPYRADRSTFLIETDQDTWRRAGFDATTDDTPFDASDEHSLGYLTKAFHDELQGHPLIGNRTRWLRFRTVTCDRWHDGNVVLLGDAVHTAHYSIGSGTKLAMEDGIALVRALDEAGDLETALRRYEEERRPEVEHLQETAHRSMLWWESFPGRLEVPVETLLVSYMTRAGKVTLDRFADLAPEVVRVALARFAGCDPASVPDSGRAAWVLRDRTVGASGRAPVPVDLPDAWGASADALVGRVRGPVVLSCADAREPVLTLFDVGERLRREADSVVTARLDRRWAEFAASALASGRIDFVEFTD